MAGYIAEFFGYDSTDKSEQSLTAAAQRHCPFVNASCMKTLGHERQQVASGACAVRQIKSDEPIICCPQRLYADDNQMLRIVGEMAFGRSDLGYYSGTVAVGRAVAEGGAIAVFGQGWGGELRLPKRTVDGEKVGNYFMDWVLARLDDNGVMIEFTAIEVQTIDTTGNYRASRDALLHGRNMKSSSVGLNWENVNKRILPQLIYKGQVLQRERRCRSGLWFVTPEPVFQRIQTRLGGADNVGYGFPSQPGAIHFLRYDYDRTSRQVDGVPRPLAVIGCETTTVERVNAAFGHVVLPEAGVYESALREALGFPNHGVSVEFGSALDVRT